MKTLKTLLVSALVTLSMHASLSAADLSEQTATMNRELQSRIDNKLEQSLQHPVRRPAATVIMQTSTRQASAAGQIQHASRS